MFSPVARFIVQGNSMAPAFKDTERLLINRLIYKFRSPEPGEIVVLRHPQNRQMFLLKRILRIDDSGFFVISEDLEAGNDSRSFGAVKRGDIIGKYLARY